MRYHNITTDDMLNGNGLRTVLWLAGCEHHCPGCQNPVTWDPNGGLEFDESAEKELFERLDKDYISGITFSGGDPLHPKNRLGVYNLLMEINTLYSNKNIWLYTGYTWEDIVKDGFLTDIVYLCDVVVDGKFEKDLADINYHWAGSTNQRIIDVHESLGKGCIVGYSSDSDEISLFSKKDFNVPCECDI